MYFGVDEVQRLVEGIWSAVLGWEVSAGPAAAGPEESPDRLRADCGAGRSGVARLSRRPGTASGGRDVRPWQ